MCIKVVSEHNDTYKDGKKPIELQLEAIDEYVGRLEVMEEVQSVKSAM